MLEQPQEQSRQYQSDKKRQSRKQDRHCVLRRLAQTLEPLPFNEDIIPDSNEI